MKTVIVTGANGFVGSHLAKELSENDFSVIGIGGGTKKGNNSTFFAEFKVLDLMDPEAVNTIDFTKVDSVIHLAGLAAPAPSFDKPMKYINTNIGIEVNLFEAALAQNAKPRFIVISSGTLYDPKSPMPFTESSNICPNSPYAISKIGQEQTAQYYAIRGFECIVVRPFNHIGPGQNPGFIVPDLAKQIVEFEKDNSKAIKVGNLDAKRDYTDVRDIVRAYRLLLDKGIPGETYNVCSGASTSGHEILAGLLEAANCKPSVVKNDAMNRPSDREELYGSLDKLSADTGWQPEIPLKTTLSDVITDWRNRK